MVRYNALKGIYDVEKTIGCGGFAKVKLATHVATGEKVAIKIMSKSLLGDDLPRVKLELKALRTLSHQHICKLYQVIETDTHFFIVIEYCSGGELFDHIVEKNRLSEFESRMFFRQIVSAVAYLHSLGYAHRDLKPENVLLDKYQNLKLIDFGLCAKPDGGMGSPLFTSCGSPTYAAPELVLGKQYLGTEVDVWAMGVLLYALLAGSLPFDDLNIDSLYKKILSGKYEEPSFMSTESRRLIRSMLQVDPKKRITVNELLSHSWLTLDILEPVQYKSIDNKHFDDECVNAMVKHYNIEPDKLKEHLKKWKYDYHTATYFLLLARKRRGSVLRVNNVPVKLPLKETVVERRKPILKPLNIPSNTSCDKTTPTLLTPDITKFVFTPDKIDSFSTPDYKTFSSPECTFEKPKIPLNIRKPQKRIRSPTLDEDGSPVPAKKATPGRSTQFRTPDSKNTPTTSDTPGSARRVLGSIERSLHKVRHVLTPRKPQADSDTQPASLTSKDLCNVSTTQCRDPEFVINELSKALSLKGIHCNRKGFTLRGKLEPNVLQRFGGCSFELEICYLPNLCHQSQYKSCATPTKSILKNGPLNFHSPITGNTTISTPNSHKKKENNKVASEPYSFGYSPFVGIRRKRLKGDSWCYKKVCEQVLALTSTDFKPALESTDFSSVLESAV